LKTSFQIHTTNQSSCSHFCSSGTYSTWPDSQTDYREVRLFFVETCCTPVHCKQKRERETERETERDRERETYARVRSCESGVFLHYKTRSSLNFVKHSPKSAYDLLQHPNALHVAPHCIYVFCMAATTSSDVDVTKQH
jgi:hypothetical protein